jgi:drug/metabolite transporter (DMT)-like permease
MKKIGSFHLLAVATILCWSIAYVFTRLSMRHFSAYSLGFVRYAVASVALAAVALILKIHPPARRDWGWFIASGATGFFLYMISFNKGAATETAATGSVIIATAPVMTALLSRIMFGERLGPLQWFATAVEFAGILVLTLTNGIMSVGAGVPWLFLAAFLLSLFNLTQRRLTRSYTGLQSSMYSIFAGTLMFAPFMPEAVEQVASASPEYLWYAVMLGVFSSAVAYVLWSIALKRAPDAASVSNYMFLTPFLASALGFLIAGERPDFATVSGGLVILGGVFIFNLGGRAVRS